MAGGWSALATAPWRRAPMLAFRAPGVVLAVLAATAVLAMAGASGPLFVSSTGSAALSREVDKECPESRLPSVVYPRSDEAFGTLGVLQDPAGLRRVDETVSSSMVAAGLPAPGRVLIAPTALTVAGRDATTTLFARAGADSHVQVLQRIPGDGLMLSDLGARRLGVRLGGTLSVRGQSVRVTGLYRDLNGPGFGTGVPRYWCTWSALLLTTLERRPPPLALTDEATLLRLSRASANEPGTPRQDGATVTWYSPIPAAASTLTQARGFLTHQAQLGPTLAQRDGTLASSVSLGGDLEEAVARSSREQTGVRGPVLPTSVAGMLVSLLLVAGAGAYWAERRRREAALLTARGVGPWALGAKAVLEMIVPALVGAVLGWLGAQILVRALGPSRLVEPGATLSAARMVAAGLVVGLALLGVAAISRQRSAERGRRRHPAARLLPWELTLFAAALLAYLSIRDGSGISSDSGTISVSPLLVTYPLLALAGGLVVAARLLALVAGQIRRRSGGLPVAAFLAARRLSAGGLVTLVLGSLIAIPAGVLVYGGVITRSTEATVEAKADVYTGAEQAVVTHAPPAAAIDTGGHGTVVSVLTGTITDTTTSEREAAVLGITPASFASFAYGDAGVLGYRLQDEINRLAGPPTTRGAVRALLIGCPSCNIRTVTLRFTTIPITIVGRQAVFPGMRQLRSPALVMERDALAKVDNFADREEEVWTTTQQLPALAQRLAAADVQVDRQKTPERFLDVTDLVPLTWSFSYLQALAALTGLVGVAGLLLHLGARQRAATVAYPMLRRMGLSRPRHFRSLVDELLVLLGAAASVGGALGLAAAVSVHRLLDLDPDFPPPTLLRIPPLLVVALVAAVLGLTALAALVTQHTADRIPAAEALRIGG